MRVFLDTNVVCDALFDRDPWKADALAIVDLARQNSLIAIVSALTVANVYYLGRKLVGRRRAATTVRTCLDSFEVLSLDCGVLAAAVGRHGSDFEDDLQLSLAIAAQVDAVITRDAQGFAASPLPVGRHRNC